MHWKSLSHHELVIVVIVDLMKSKGPLLLKADTTCMMDFADVSECVVWFRGTSSTNG